MQVTTAPLFSCHLRTVGRVFLLVLLLCGVAPAAVSAQPVSTATKTYTNMQKFVIIFRQGPRPLSEADKQRRQQEVSDWAHVQNAAGHKLEPRILGPEVAHPGAAASRKNPGVTSEWPVTALLFLDATDLTEAAKVAESHPALQFGVTVEVRPWGSPVVPPTPQPAQEK